MPVLRFVCLLTGLYSLAAPLSADVLLIDSIEQEPPNSPQGVQRPAKGMTMAQVERAFGAPAKKYPPVGEPPITRWVYDKFTVYFEHQYVLHSVVHR